MSINLTKLDEKLSVTGQISTDDLHEIADSGYKSIICNRPDFEGGADQPTSEQLEASAKSLGIVFVYLPVAIGAVSTEHGEKFKELVDTLPGPILAFCALGKRAVALYSLAKQEASVEQLPMSDEWLTRPNKTH